jgi:hypothetical protein
MVSPFFRWCRIVVLSGLLLLGACSGTTFVYNRLDFLLPWYVDDYAKLDGQQETYLAQLIAPFLSWHRNQELPSYVQIVVSIETSLDQPQTAARIAALFAGLESAWLRLEGQALDWLLALGAQLSDEQIAGFISVMWEQQAEYEQEYLERSDEEFYEDSYDNLVDNAKDYLGALSEEQRKLLRESSRRLLRSDQAWLQERAEWVTKLAVLLKREPHWQQRVRDAVAARRQDLSPEYRRIYEHNMGVIYELIATLLNVRSAQQDKFLRDKLEGLRKDLDTLIEQGKSKMARLSPPDPAPLSLDTLIEHVNPISRSHQLSATC